MPGSVSYTHLVINLDYIRTSRARGIPQGKIIFSHALKNAIIPVLTAIGLYFGGLLAGSTITAVSYTHLDVYKRQDVSTTRSSGSPSRQIY